LDEGARADARHYISLPLRLPLREALRGCVVVEFPSVLVLTREEAAMLAEDGKGPRWTIGSHPAGLE
jgi:hypothetical protein